MLQWSWSQKKYQIWLKHIGASPKKINQDQEDQDKRKMSCDDNNEDTYVTARDNIDLMSRH